MIRDSQDGLGWDDSGLDLEPKWTREPSIDAIESICRQQLGIEPEETLQISFFASGAFNKLYLISSTTTTATTTTTTTDPLLMRVSLPVHPRHKTRGEVATLQWVRDNTEIPVPKVVAFQDSNDNEIGFEWILLELMPGTPVYRRWRTMSMEQKVALTNRIAEFEAQLASCGSPDTTFRNIGTLEIDLKDENDGKAKTCAPGQMVSHNFFMGDHLHYDVPRGPFRSTHDWLRSELNIIVIEQIQLIAKAEDEDDRQEAQEHLRSAEKLLGLLPKVFPAEQDSLEATAIYHDDLNLNNILVDEEGNITAVVDWECVSALPIWMAAKYPRFLRDGGRDEKPERESYSNEQPISIYKGALADGEDDDDDDDLDNEGKNPLYWYHLMEWEVTQLQKVYDARMEQLWPDRLSEDRLNLKLDFFEALVQCSAGLWFRAVTKWVDRVEGGEAIRWLDIFG